MLCLAEKLKLSGRAIIEAVAVGLEVHWRTCLPFDATGVGMVLPPTAGMGCAAAAAKAFGLSAEQATHAIGCALSSSSMAEVSMGTDAHFLESSFQSLQGLVGAEMARAGMTSNPDLDGFRGLFAADVSLEEVTAELSQRWWFIDMWIKKYPNCFLVHRQLDALFDLMAEHELGYDDIEEVVVHVNPADASCDRPEPVTVGDRQFSFQHSLGVAMVEGELTLEHFADPAIAADPRYEQARRKVTVAVRSDEQYDNRMEYPTTVRVRATGGREFVQERQASRGSPDDPLTTEALSSLYRRFTKSRLAPKRVEGTLALLWHLENLADIHELMRILTFECTENGRARSTKGRDA